MRLEVTNQIDHTMIAGYPPRQTNQSASFLSRMNLENVALHLHRTPASSSCGVVLGSLPINWCQSASRRCNIMLFSPHRHQIKFVLCDILELINDRPTTNNVHLSWAREGRSGRGVGAVIEWRPFAHWNCHRQWIYGEPMIAYWFCV